jgi:iron complex outermembrane receptor protein
LDLFVASGLILFDLRLAFSLQHLVASPGWSLSVKTKKNTEDAMSDALVNHKNPQNKSYIPQLAVKILTLAFCGQVWAQSFTLNEVSVHEQKPKPWSFGTKGQDLLNQPYLSLPELGQSLPGMQSSRAGGHGGEPVIRGLQQGAVTVLFDDGYRHGACPNRMDPPTTYGVLSAGTEVELTSGYSSVRYGFGGVGGQIRLVDRPWSLWGAAKPWWGQVSTLYESNTNLNTLTLGLGSFLNSERRGLLRGQWNLRGAQNYQDGGGNFVRSAFAEQQGQLQTSWFYGEQSLVTLSHDRILVKDATFQAKSMDAPLSDLSNFALRGEHQLSDEHKILWSAYSNRVDHVMDNYSLRPLANPMMKMKVDAMSANAGLRLEWQQAQSWFVGLEAHRWAQDAKRWSGASLSTYNARIWPDVTQDLAALYAEKSWDLGEEWGQVKFGLRGEQIQSRAQDIAGVGAATSATSLYQSTYAQGARDQRQHQYANVVLGYQKPFAETWLGGIYFSRSQRVGNATELFIAVPSAAANMRWVGNPHLKPEEHRQLEAFFHHKAEEAQQELKLSFYVDEVKDYIFRDRAKGQQGLLVNDQRAVYRNIPARLWGQDMWLRKQWFSHDFQSYLGYTRGENLESNISLPQMIPLGGWLRWGYHWMDLWQTALRLRWATKQEFVDTDPLVGSGRDQQKTPAWEVVDLELSWQQKELSIQAGVRNVFNRDYTQHLNQADVVTPLELQVAEPGRSYFVNLAWQF